MMKREMNVCKLGKKAAKEEAKKKLKSVGVMVGWIARGSPCLPHGVGARACTHLLKHNLAQIRRRRRRRRRRRHTVDHKRTSARARTHVRPRLTGALYLSPGLISSVSLAPETRVADSVPVQPLKHPTQMRATTTRDKRVHQALTARSRRRAFPALKWRSDSSLRSFSLSLSLFLLLHTLSDKPRATVPSA